MKQMILWVFLAISTLAHAQREKAEAYIANYKNIAIAEMQRTGVPAAIKLAQGILESQYGESDLVKTSNNHFGIKCKTEWTGARTYHDDDERKECFRVYASAEESYRDHSNFLRTRDHYAFLFKLDPTDNIGWAYGLKKAGYATEKNYPENLLKVISDYQLQQYNLVTIDTKSETKDTLISTTTAAVKKQVVPKENQAYPGKKLRIINQTSSNDTLILPMVTAAITPSEPEEKTDTLESEKEPIPIPKIIETKKTSPYPSNIFTINHTNVIYAESGTSLLSIANNYGISLSKLLEFNELKEIDILDADQLLFLEKKLKKGATDFHTVSINESLTDISQKEGVRLDSLMEYNNIKKDKALLSGQKILLRTPPTTVNKTVKVPK